MIATVSPPSPYTPINSRRWPRRPPAPGSVESVNYYALTNGLLASWPLVVPFGTTVSLADDSGILGNLTGWSVAPTFAALNPFSDALGSALHTGVGGAFRLDTAAQLNQASLTFTCWFRITNKTGAQRIIHYGTGGAATTFTLRFSSVLDRVVWHVYDAAAAFDAFVVGNVLGAPAVDTWYFAHCFYDGASQRAGLHLWEDGINPNIGETFPLADAGLVAVTKNPAAGTLNIGNGPNLERFKGYIYDVSTWSRLLNLNEAKWVYLNSAYGWPVITPASGDITTPTAPAAPTNLAETGTNNYAFTDNTGGLNQHEVWRDDGTGSTFTLIATLAVGVDAFEDLTGSALNIYKVRAIGIGNPSAFCSLAGTYFMTNGRVLLKSDDALWYFVGLSTTDGVTTLDIDQTDTAAPTTGAELISFQCAADSYTFGLVTVDGVVTWEVDQSAAGQDPIASINLLSDDYQLYTLSIVQDGAEFTHDINQTPV